MASESTTTTTTTTVSDRTTLSILRPGNLVPQSFHSAAEKKKMAAARPIDYILDFIGDRIGGIKKKIKPKGIGSRVLILKSMTGSGKSTTIAPELYNKFFRDSKQLIVVTQPRVYTTTTIPFQILRHYKSIHLDENIGYITGAMKTSGSRGISFQTIGSFLMQFTMTEDEKICGKYGVVFVDEVHVRDVQTDLVLFYIKQFLTRNWKEERCPLFVLMSATFEPKLFMDYYECPRDHYIEVKGLSYPIENLFSKYELCDYVAYAADKALETHLDNIAQVVNGDFYRDILIFVQGKRDMKEIIKRLNEFNTAVYEWENASADDSSARASEYAALIKERIEKNKVGGGAARGRAVNYYVCPIGFDRSTYNTGSEDDRNMAANIKSITVPIMAAVKPAKGRSAKAKRGGRDDHGEYNEHSESFGSINTSGIGLVSGGYAADRAGESAEIARVKPGRKIIVATNIVETGATINTLRYCIDTGYAKVREFNPTYSIYLFINKNVTQEAATQRKGRVGRQVEGTWIPCYPQEIYEKMPPQAHPQIMNSDITQNLLALIVAETETELIFTERRGLDMHSYMINGEEMTLKSAKEFDAAALDFVQYPPADSICYSMEKLYGLGFIDAQYRPTLFGWFAHKIYKLSIENIRMIFAGFTHGANVLDLITIACMVNAGFALRTKKNRPRDPYTIGRAGTHHSEDAAAATAKVLIGDELIEMLFIWYEFMSLVDRVTKVTKRGDKKRTAFERTLDTHKTKKIDISFDELNLWARENNYNINLLYEISVLRDEVISNLLMLGIDPYYNGLNLRRGTYNLCEIWQRNDAEGFEEVCKIKKCIYDGYRYNTAVYDDKAHAYVTAYSHVPLVIDSWVTSGVRQHVTSGVRTRGGGKSQGKRSESPQGKRSESQDDFVVIRPRSIIVTTINLIDSYFNPGKYEFSAGGVSALDGFISIDLDF